MQNQNNLQNDARNISIFKLAWPIFVQMVLSISLGYIDKVNMLMTGGLIVGFVTGLIIAFKQNLAPILSPVYAFAEGALLGGLSCIFEAKFPGIVVQAVALTFLAIFAMAVLFKTGIIRATEKFRSTLFIATTAIVALYLINIALSFFHVQIPALYSSNPLGIALSILIVGIAALNLIIDFEFIERGAEKLLPKYFEWYCAFGLLVTIVWLYIELLRLLSKLRDR